MELMLLDKMFVFDKDAIPALTNTRKIKLPIGQSAGENWVAPIKIQVAPLFLPRPIVNSNLFDDFMTHSNIPIAIASETSMEFALLRIMKIGYISEEKKSELCTLNKLCSDTYSMDVSRFKRRIDFSEKGGVYCRGDIQYRCYIQFCQTRGIYTHSFQNIGGKFFILVESPSLALDTTLIQDLTGRNAVERFNWKYVYLEARINSHNMHLYDKNL